MLFPETSNADAASSIYQLSDYLYRYYGKKVIILLDEYDTPMQEAFDALEECSLGAEKEKVKKWYDGFTFGSHSDIYNPWSILNVLGKKKIGTYWANTSSHSLVGKLVREGSSIIKENFETLMQGMTITAAIDEQIVCNQLDEDEDAIWSLLLASGYLKVLSVDDTPLMEGTGEMEYTLALTNMEVRSMFASMIRGWFKGRSKGDYNGFIKAASRNVFTTVWRWGFWLICMAGILLLQTVRAATGVMISYWNRTTVMMQQLLWSSRCTTRMMRKVCRKRWLRH